MRWATSFLLSFGFLALSLLQAPEFLHVRAARAAMPLATRATSTARRSVQKSTAGKEITRRNWKRHPKIKSVQTIVRSVDASLKKGRYEVSKRRFEYCEPYQDTVRIIAADARGHVRRYEKQAGSEDSSLTWKHYYDGGGHLRFVLISGGAVNGSELEHRIYFDEEGQRIWEEQKYVKGPGYTFPKVWPKEEIQMADPGKAFHAKSPCPEIKSSSRRRKRT